jgi:hypothetical protein
MQGAMRIPGILAFVAMLAPLAPAPCAAADAIGSGNAGSLSLGANWGPYESFRGTSFRWVANDAVIVLHGAPGEARIAIVCEGGPSLQKPEVFLRVLDTARRQVDHVMCEGPGHPTTMLLPATGGDTRYVLHVDGGGKRVPGDRRILNFRVYDLDDGSDVTAPRGGVRLGAGWYGVEHFNAQTFRWINGDGHLLVTSDRPGRAFLRLLVEVGPSVGSSHAVTVLRDRQGHVVQRSTLVGRTVWVVPLQLGRGEADYTIGVTSANKPVPGDKRILNLRLFGASLQR